MKKNKEIASYFLYFFHNKQRLHSPHHLKQCRTFDTDSHQSEDLLSQLRYLSRLCQEHQHLAKWFLHSSFHFWRPPITHKRENFLKKALRYTSNVYIPDFFQNFLSSRIFYLNLSNSRFFQDNRFSGHLVCCPYISLNKLKVSLFMQVKISYYYFILKLNL